MSTFLAKVEEDPNFNILHTDFGQSLVKVKNNFRFQAHVIHLFIIFLMIISASSLNTHTLVVFSVSLNQEYTINVP